eukprot:477026-Pelagomonas_calceolata.AAC.2
MHTERSSLDAVAEEDAEAEPKNSTGAPGCMSLDSCAPMRVDKLAPVSLKQLVLRVGKCSNACVCAPFFVHLLEKAMKEARNVLGCVAKRPHMLRAGRLRTHACPIYFQRFCREEGNLCPVYTELANPTHAQINDV